MKNRILVALLLLVSPFVSNAQFITKPYLQIGYEGDKNSLALLWHTKDTLAQWKVEIAAEKQWFTMPNIGKNNVVVQNIQPFSIYHTKLENFKAGANINYRIWYNNQIVFSSHAQTPKAFEQPYSFVAIGDIGAEKIDQKKLAQLAFNLSPDFVAIPGDIVYDEGRVSEYAKKFWPIYNADTLTNEGAPLMRSIPFFAAVGNHDVDNTNLDRTPDGLAYYYFWEQPLNGPIISNPVAAYPSFSSNDNNKKAFLNAAGKAYPKMNHFSYDYGNAHWLVLDADNYVDWTNKELLEWVREDLKKADKAIWKFVLYHQPGFNSSREHFEQQQMRLLAPLFEAAKVDVVFTGHVHNYQRSFPMTFVPDRKGTLLMGGKDNSSIRGRVVNGKWTLDKTFDGKLNKSPKGVIYIVTGAGGADLYNPEQTNDPDSWQKFTSIFYATAHSLSHIQVNGNQFILKQINTEGKVVDQFEIVK